VPVLKTINTPRKKTMPAKFVKSYQSPSGAVFPTLKEAQQDELMTLLSPDGIAIVPEITVVSDFLVNHAEEIIDCLSQRERKNLPKAVASKPRKPRKPAPTRTGPEERPAVVAHTEAMKKG
jgi:hypothetical protein